MSYVFDSPCIHTRCWLKVFVCLVILWSDYSIYIATPPEVNIEVPSDSDSSRRPSAISSTYSGRRRSSFNQVLSNSSSINELQRAGKSKEEKSFLKGNTMSPDQPITAEDSEFAPCQRSNSGQISFKNSNDNGKIVANLNNIFPNYKLF